MNCTEDKVFLSTERERERENCIDGKAFLNSEKTAPKVRRSLTMRKT